MSAVSAAMAGAASGMAAGGGDAVDAAVDVLVVEDDGPTRGLLIDVLTFAGYTASGAPDGAAALALAERLRPRLILLDLWMPVMDGWQFVAHYRCGTEETAPIVLLSADQRLPEATERLGAYGFIQKPFDLDFFREVVARAISVGASEGGRSGGYPVAAAGSANWIS